MHIRVPVSSEEEGTEIVLGARKPNREMKPCRLIITYPRSVSLQIPQPRAKGAPAAQSPRPGPLAMSLKPRRVSPLPLQPCSLSSCPAWPCLHLSLPLHRHPRRWPKWHLHPLAHHLLGPPQPQNSPWTFCGLSRRLPMPSGSWLAPFGRDWPN